MADTPFQFDCLFQVGDRVRVRDGMSLSFSLHQPAARMRVDLSGMEGKVTRITHDRNRIKVEVEVFHPQSGFTFDLYQRPEAFSLVETVCPECGHCAGDHLHYGINGPDWVCVKQ